MILSRQQEATVKAGDTVTLTISRGINYGDSVQVPDVTGMEKNDAIAKLGKFININVEHADEYRRCRGNCYFSGSDRIYR